MINLLYINYKLYGTRIILIIRYKSFMFYRYKEFFESILIFSHNLVLTTFVECTVCDESIPVDG